MLCFAMAAIAVTSLLLMPAMLLIAITLRDIHITLPYHASADILLLQLLCYGATLQPCFSI